MSELKAIIEVMDAFQTPMTAVIAWFLWRLYTNHVPHVEQCLGSIDKRLSHLEGIKEGVKLERMNK